MSLSGKRVAVLVEQQYQEMEVWYPVYRLREAGCVVELIAPEAGKTYASKLGYPAKSTLAASDAKADQFAALVIPGGFAPDFFQPAVRVSTFFAISSALKSPATTTIVASGTNAAWWNAFASAGVSFSTTSFLPSGDRP